MEPLDRITADPEIMMGKPCIRGMRIPVSLVASLVASNMTTDEILAEYPYLEAEDVRQALIFASRVSGSKSAADLIPTT